MKNDALTPIHIVTTLRTGTCPDGYVIQDRVIMPLTKRERDEGQHNELKEWYNVYGEVQPRHCPHRRQPSKVRPPRQKPVPNDPPKEVQEEVYKEMKRHFDLVAFDLARTKVINYADVPDMAHDLFRMAIKELPKWNPAKASRKTYLYKVTADNKIDIARALNAKKRGGDASRVSITAAPSAAEEDADYNALQAGAVSEEIIPNEATTVERLEFKMSLFDFLSMLDADELLVLQYLISEVSEKDIAKMMGLNRSSLRRGILESLEMKATYCGIVPYGRKGKSRS